MISKSIYFAGELFDLKHLTGNAMLADAIGSLSQGRYHCVLPQLLEQSAERSEDIRNNDLKQVHDCDLALFNFDGTELDSGTVVEFMYAKFLDKPSVILRSDFRLGGDQRFGEPWNLMCSFYPRTEVVLMNSMQNYQLAMHGQGSLAKKLQHYHAGIAQHVIDAFDSVCAQPSLMDEPGVDKSQIYHWAKIFAGKGYQQLFKAKGQNALDNEQLNISG